MKPDRESEAHSKFICTILALSWNQILLCLLKHSQYHPEKFALEAHSFFDLEGVHSATLADHAA